MTPEQVDGIKRLIDAAFAEGIRSAMRTTRAKIIKEDYDGIHVEINQTGGVARTHQVYGSRNSLPKTFLNYFSKHG